MAHIQVRAAVEVVGREPAVSIFSYLLATRHVDGDMMVRDQGALRLQLGTLIGGLRLAGRNRHQTAASSAINQAVLRLLLLLRLHINFHSDLLCVPLLQVFGILRACLLEAISIGMLRSHV